VLSDVYGPGLDGFPDAGGEVQLNAFVSGAEVGAVDGAVVDGKEIGPDLLFIQLTDEPLRFLGLGKALGATAFGSNFPQFHFQRQPCLNDGLGEG